MTQKYKTLLVTQLQHYLSFLMQKWSSTETRTWKRQILNQGPFLECPDSYWAWKAVAVHIQDGSLNSFADNVMKLLFKKTNGPVCRQGLMPSLVRFWLKRLISGPKRYRDFHWTGQGTSTALFHYLSLLVARGLFLYEEYLLEERTGGIWVQI